MTKTALAPVAAAAVALIAAASAGATPIYMQNSQNINNPALQPPPVCCIPGYETITGKLRYRRRSTWRTSAATCR